MNRVNILPCQLDKIMSKLYESVLLGQLCEYLYGILVVIMSGTVTHDCKTLLLNMVERWKQAMDKGEWVGPLLIELNSERFVAEL